jgi:thioredoxin 1
MFADPDVVHVNELNFDDEVRNSALPVFLDASTEWCGPCRVAAPVVVELARRHRGRLKVVTIDGDESPNLAAELGVRGFPTFLGIVGGRVVSRRAGFGGKRPLEALADELLEIR